MACPCGHVTVDAAEGIATAARELMEKDVGVLPVFHGQEIVGIATDRESAIRALSAGLGGDTPVSIGISRTAGQHCQSLAFAWGRQSLLMTGGLAWA